MRADPQPGQTWVVDRSKDVPGPASRGRLIVAVWRNGAVDYRHVGKPKTISVKRHAWRSWAEHCGARPRDEIV